MNPVKKSSPVPAVTNNSNNNSKPEEAQRAKSYGKEVSPRKNTGITVGPGAAAWTHSALSTAKVQCN